MSKIVQTFHSSAYFQLGTIFGDAGVPQSSRIRKKSVKIAHFRGFRMEGSPNSVPKQFFRANIYMCTFPDVYLGTKLGTVVSIAKKKLIFLQNFCQRLRTSNSHKIPIVPKQSPQILQYESMEYQFSLEKKLNVYFFSIKFQKF